MSSAPRAFDRYMIVEGAGKDTALAALTDSERCAHFLGVLSIASHAPVRGYLLVGEEEAAADHVALEASVSKRVAQSAMAKLKKIGILERHEDIGAWHVRNWERINPEPKKDPNKSRRLSAVAAGYHHNRQESGR